MEIGDTNGTQAVLACVVLKIITRMDLMLAPAVVCLSWTRALDTSSAKLLGHVPLGTCRTKFLGRVLRKLAVQSACVPHQQVVTRTPLWD